MVNINTTDNLDFLFKSFEKNLYFKSKLLTVEGFQREQYLNIYKHQLINCLVHGHGILYGLEVTKEEISFDKNSKKITAKLSAGAALDCFGRLILVPDSNQAKEAEDTYQAGKVNYLYLVYDEFSAGIASALDETNCDNACTDDYIKETYKLIISITPPAGLISGKVQTEEKPILGAKIEALDTNKTVKAVTFTNELGEYSLFVSAGTYTLQASAPNFKTTKISNVTITDLTTPIENQNFSLTAASSNSKIQSCQDLTKAYYTDYLRFPPECMNSKVFLAVLTGKDAKVDEEATKKYRSLVYNNPMLHQLLCDHLNDFNNPHRTTAAQVKALQSVNKVGNADDRPYVSNIDLVPDDENTISITPDPTNNRIQISSNLRIDPGDDIQSVKTAREAGDSIKLAREDHVHDLADKVVTGEKIDDNAVERKKHLADITKLITSNNRSISLEENNTEKTIDLSTNIATGIVNFSGITPGACNISGAIIPFPTEGDPKKMEGIAIAMAIEAEVNRFFARLLSGELEKSSYVYMGDTAFIPLSPLIIALYNSEETFFKIFLADRRVKNTVTASEEADEITWKVRWWAIPGKLPGQQLSVEARNNDNFFASPVMLNIAMNPGITQRELASTLGVEREELQSLLTDLQTSGLITCEGQGINRKFFLQ